MSGPANSPGETWPGEERAKAQTELRRLFPAWEVIYTERSRWIRQVHIPAGFYAVSFDLGAPPVFASDLKQLKELLKEAELGRRETRRRLPRLVMPWLLDVMRRGRPR